jgi:hypothetical protein
MCTYARLKKWLMMAHALTEVQKAVRLFTMPLAWQPGVGGQAAV